MDWSVPVRVWLIELSSYWPAKNTAIRELLASKGYAPLAGILAQAKAPKSKQVPWSKWGIPSSTEAHLAGTPSGDDEVFVHSSLLSSVPDRIASCARCPSPRWKH